MVVGLNRLGRRSEGCGEYERQVRMEEEVLVVKVADDDAKRGVKQVTASG